MVAVMDDDAVWPFVASDERSFVVEKIRDAMAALDANRAAKIRFDELSDSGEYSIDVRRGGEQMDTE